MLLLLLLHTAFISYYVLLCLDRYPTASQNSSDNNQLLGSSLVPPAGSNAASNDSQNIYQTSNYVGEHPIEDVTDEDEGDTPVTNIATPFTKK